MTSQVEACSILAVDIGSCRTKAALFEVVEGRHRFVARSDVATTLYHPVEDVSVGVRQAIEKIEQICGRTLMGSSGPIIPEKSDGTGVDFFVTTTSVGGPLRLLVISTSAVSPLLNQLRGVTDLIAVDTEVLLLDELGGASEVRMGALSKVLLRFDPHAVFVVQQESDGASVGQVGREIVEAISTMGLEAVPIRFIGDLGGAESFAHGIRDILDFRVLVSSGLSSNDGLLVIERELAELSQQRLTKEIPGYPLLISWQNTPVECSFFACGNSLRFLSSYYKTDVLAVDIGASSASLFKLTAEVGQAKLSYKYGVGRSGIGLLDGNAGSSDETPTAQGLSIRRWLPVELTDEEVGNAILNKWARPWTIPETDEEMLFERAVGVECVQRLRSELGDQPHFFRCQDSLGMVIGSGGLLGRQKSPGRMALTLLDALEPAGVFTMAVDRDALLPQLGIAGRICSQAAAEVLLADAYLDLGTCIACVSSGRPGSKAATIEVKRGGGTEKIEVASGEIRVIPLPLGKTAEVVVNPSRNFDFSWGKGKSGRLTVKGGALGLIIDTRGRPLIPSNSGHLDETRRWLESIDLREAE